MFEKFPYLNLCLPIVDSSSSTVGDSCILIGVPCGGGDMVPGSISRSLSESSTAKSSDINRLGTVSVTIETSCTAVQPDSSERTLTEHIDPHLCKPRVLSPLRSVGKQ